MGKTTVATGLMAAFAARGRRVGAAKVGPDFIDPGYHALATGRPARNLDAWMCGDDAIAPLAVRAGDGCDLLIIEGVMGLFDGAGSGSFASTAHVAGLLGAPVVLVVDAGAMSASVAALVHGFTSYDPDVRVAGVILNRVGSDSHEQLLRAALSPGGVPVLGVLRRDAALAWRDRHLGLVPVVEQPDRIRATLDRLAAAIDRGCDLEAVEVAARSAPPQPADPLREPERWAGGAVPIAVAGGPAFSFMYPDNLSALGAAGAEIIPFDPLECASVPDGARGLIVGGGFPEVYAARLGGNTPLLDDVRAKVTGGLPTWAECGGLLWLGRTLDDEPMTGVLPADGRMTSALTLGYRQATTHTSSPLGPAGTVVKGHEFHYSTIDPGGDALEMTGRTGPARGGFASPTLLASYLHVHLATRPDLAERFVATCAPL